MILTGALSKWVSRFASCVRAATSISSASRPMISPKVQISSSLYRPAINRSVACHSARLRLSAVPREIASSRSLRNDFTSLILTDLKSQQNAGKRYSLRSVITSKGNFLVKEGGQVPPLKNSLKCLLFWLLFGHANLLNRAPMKNLPRIVAVLALLLSAPADAIVGGGVPSAEGIGRSVVTIVGSRGNFCTGALIAPKLVLTAAHCVQPGAVYKIVEYGTDRQPQLQDVKSIAIHPAFNMQAMTAHRATADVALLQLEAPPKGKNAADLGVPQVPIVAGSRFTIAGIGVTIRGEGSSGGIIRVAGLVAAGQPGTLQIRLVDPVGQGTRDGLGACTGDSGGPVFEDRQGGPAIRGVISRSTGAYRRT